MPKIYRSMKKEEDDKPVVGSTGKGLGVRAEQVNGITDVDIDNEGNVILNGKGMSVAPQWRDLPFFLIPKRLVNIFPDANGSPKLYCFTMGGGDFEEGHLTNNLDLIIDKKTHGVVAPQTLVSISQYQNDLAATRDQWSIDED